MVQQYIETAQPVGSSTVSAREDVAVSSATVRNDMTQLERDGYLAQPHTSAGRVPTEKGYRYFVDTLAGPGPLNPNSVRMVREFFATTGAPPNPGPKIPRLVIDRSIRKPDSLRQAVRDMWRIAFGPPMHISAQRWFELEPYFERLRKAHDDGKWRFETGE